MVWPMHALHSQCCELRVLCGPVYPQLCPRELTKVTLEDHVGDIFFDGQITQYTVEVVANIIMPSLEHVSSIESICE